VVGARGPEGFDALLDEQLDCAVLLFAAPVFNKTIDFFVSAQFIDE